MATVTAKSRAKLRTSMGDMTLEFLVDKAPRTVENFVTLARKGFYDGLTFHRVMKDFIVQGGCRNGDGTSKSDYTIRPEFNDTPHVKGVVSMARNNDPHSAFSQFFICHGESRYLDSRYTAFARVIDGLEVLDKIANVPTDIETHFNEKSVPRDPIYINGIDLTDVAFDEQGSAPAPSRPAPRADDDDESEGEGADDGDAVAEADAGAGGDDEADGDERKSRRTRRGGRGRRGGGKGPAPAEESAAAADSGHAGKAEAKPRDADEEPAAKSDAKSDANGDDKDDAKGDDDAPKPRKKATRRRRTATPKSGTKSNDDGE